jgi:small subunit ribosomal protein S16
VLMIRLARVGATKQPHYRVVVIEKDRARNGRSIEVVGTYNPRTSPATLDLKRERIDYWTGNGAQLSERVGKLMSSAPVTPAAAPVPPVVAPAAPEAVAPEVESAAAEAETTAA